MESNKKIILHVGSPKTATTFIQTSLENNKNIFKDLGYDILGPDQVRELDFYVYLHLINTNKKQYIKEKDAKMSFQNTISQLSHNKVIISEEGILHDLMPSILTNGAFGGIRNTAKAIREIIRNDTTIILTIRNQVDFIQSTYKHLVKWKLYSIPFKEFLQKEIDLKRLSWKFVIDTLEEYFPGKVKVVPYELIKISQNKYFNQFLKASGVHDTKEYSKFILEDIVENKAMPDNQALFVQLINKAYKETASVKLKSALKIGLFTDEIFKDEAPRKLSSFKINSSLANEVNAYYKEENYNILKQYCSEKNAQELMKFY